MAQIPGTKFTELQPPGRTGNVPIPSSLASTGGEGALVAGVANIGQAITTYAMNTIKQDQVLEFNEKRRQIRERGWAAANAVTGDPEADRELFPKLEADAQEIIASAKWKDVGDDLTRFVNDEFPNWKQGIEIDSLRRQRANNKDRYDIEGIALLEKGDISGYTDLTRKMADPQIGVISPVQADDNIKIANSMSILLRAENLANMGKPIEAKKLLKELSPKDLNHKQIKQRKAIVDLSIKIANDELEIKKDETTRDLYGKFVRGKLTDPEEAIRAFENGLMDKSVLDDILNGKDSPTTTEPDALRIANQTLTDVGNGYITKSQAYSIIAPLRAKMEKGQFNSKINDIERERNSYESNEIKEAKDMMEDAIRTRGALGMFIEDSVEDAAWAQADAMLDQFIKTARDKDGQLDTTAIKKKAIEIGRAAERKVKENKRASGTRLEELFPLPTSDKEINQKAIIQPKGTPAGLFGVHNGKGQVILNEAGIRGLLSQVTGKTIEEKIANARKLAAKRGWIIPD